MDNLRFIVIISANVEWRVIRELFSCCQPQSSPFGEWLIVDMEVSGQVEPILFFHGGWGKIAAAASTQYVLDRWSPRLLVNLGTCGGFEGSIEPGTIILAERTLVYDIIEQMGDQAEHIAHYTTNLDLSWLGEDYPQDVCRTLLVSADRDLVAEEMPHLITQYGAIAGDWESGAIAWVAARNYTPCLILRGVSDLVGPGGGAAYQGKMHVFVEGTGAILPRLVEALPKWLAKFEST
jgi:adenosylhomocysteine nucleosidase